MKKLKIVAIKPIIDKQGDTQGRRGFQVFFQKLTAPNEFSGENDRSRNFKEGYQGKGKVSGNELDIKADKLFLEIVRACGLQPNYTNDQLGQLLGDGLTPSSLKSALGITVTGEILVGGDHTDENGVKTSYYVEPYKIENSNSTPSANPWRVTKTVVAVGDENPPRAFQQQGNVLSTDPERIEVLRKMANWIASENASARAGRQAERGLEANLPTGDLTRFQQWMGKGESVYTHETSKSNPANQEVGDLGPIEVKL